MAEFKTQFEVSADPAPAFEYLADFVNVAEWDPNVRETKALGEDGPGVGSSYAVTTGFYGKAIELICEITAIEAPTRVDLSVEASRAKGRILFTIEANVSSSKARSIITYHLIVELRGAARLFDRGLQLALNGMGENAANGLKKRLNAE